MHHQSIIKTLVINNRLLKAAALTLKSDLPCCCLEQSEEVHGDMLLIDSR
jgi:hypothetical protein